ncbi:PREDICTED: putative F-box protein At5g55150 [Tarenaya hassleriana]|uniref:putative F-box protein At5g55150 n=1 Tax=Tarenaya hassleriana TaxID=28532 RepID=UPI00053C782A|nr:PREDICTED: putative F-box protein At5g55150 [Tarenaya hassleriana]
MSLSPTTLELSVTCPAVTMVESSSSLSLWSDLPPELLDSVFGGLCNLKDILRSSSVCSSWHYSASLVYHRKFVPSLAVFNGPTDKKFRILNLLKDPTHEESDRSESDFRVDSDIWFCGCTRGFLLAIGVSFPYQVHLINPYTKAISSLPSLSPLEDVQQLLQFQEISRVSGILKSFVKKAVSSAIPSNPDSISSLPSLSPLEDVQQLLQFQEISRVSGILKSFVKKAVSSAIPSNPDCIVMIIYSFDRKLALCRRRDKNWTDFESVPGISSIDDIVFYNGIFLAIDKIGEIYSCELSLDDAPKAVPMGRAAPFKYEPCKKYFAESVSGELFLALKKLEYSDEGDSTTCFVIYELDSDTGEWREVRSLKGKALFLSSRGLSMAVSAGNPGSSGGFVEENSVYFTDGLGMSDSVGVFEWESKQIKKLYQPSSWNSQLFWITPAYAY